MKLKLLLFLSFIAGLLNAQVVCEYPEGVITTLVITEARMTSTDEGYVEITNLGDQPVNLSQFKLGRLTPWVRSSAVNDLCNDPWYTETGDYIFLPDKMLEPGKSFVITNAYNYEPIHYKKYLGRLGGSEMPKQIGIYAYADKLIHMQEAIQEVVYPEDIISTAMNDPEQTVRRGDYSLVFNGLRGGTFYLEHHYTEGDSVIVDQVGGVFDNAGRNYAHTDIDIAGVQGGMSTSVVARKNIIKKGNIDFANARGISIEDSEWLPVQIPVGYNAWRDVWWTIGNHGNYVLDANTLEPKENSGISVDYAGKKITVPWGTLRLDEIMRHMKYKPGVAWNYVLNASREDSLYRSARTGDQLVVYVLGDGLTTATFDIVVKEQTSDDNIVIPIDHSNITGAVTTRAQNGILSWPRVTKNVSGVDTITGSGYGLPFDLRTDTLVKYLEKPDNATWEFVWVDGAQRADLKNGDKIKVTSQSGKVKEYYIQVQTYYPSRNVDLASITWPDIPEFYKGILGWKGDTIPYFSPGNTTYRIEVPMDVEAVPALVAKTSHVNATVTTKRAKSLTGTTEDRTITFDVTAEDDTVKQAYNVELVKEKLPGKVEPFRADPFISEFVNTYPNGRCYLEIYNPGNQPIDLRNYMVGMRNNADLYAPITYNAPWNRRYTTYIPGLKHVDEATWAVTPRLLLPDVNTNPILLPGETFVMAYIQRGEDYYPGITPYTPAYDVQFGNEIVPGIKNPWGEDVSSASSGGVPIPPNGNRKNCIFMYKVLNDSIKLGLKPNTDPNDFELIDLWGMPEAGYWVVGGYALGTNETGNVFIRKPEISQGNPELAGSFGTNPDDCEWIRVQPGIDYSHISTPARYLAAVSSLNTHYMVQPTYYKSTVTSKVYKVSDGYGSKESVMGVKTGTTVGAFLSNISKDDEGQTLTVLSGNVELAQDAVLSMNDVLKVVSADGENTTLYRLDVTEAGLSSNAYLTSTRWQITVDIQPKSGSELSNENDGVGTITGFDYGTNLKTIINNTIIPAGATVTIIDANGSYVPYKVLNFDTVYVNVTVSPDFYFDVVAEDGVTRILYQLKPNTSAGDAFILSDLYNVKQLDNLIQYVPRGTNFQAFLSNITPSLGASLRLVDKMGNERTQGNIREDDKVVVTSSNGQVTKVYFISFLPTATIPSTTYLAYILSKSYAVDQVTYNVSGGSSGLTGSTTVTEFFSKITVCTGATAVLLDEGGNVKVSGDLNQGDMLKVTSADSKISVMYKLNLNVTSAENFEINLIEIYPNPTSDILNIRGIEAGYRIQLYNATGAVLVEKTANASVESISLDKVPAGIFFIVISNNNKMLGNYKAIKN